MNIDCDRHADKNLIIEASKFYGKILLPNYIYKKIYLEILFDKDSEYEGCIINNESHLKHPRYFTLILRNGKEDDDIFSTIAHEMVHLKQYAKRELVDGYIALYKRSLISTKKWKDELYIPKKGESIEFDSPWEIEAYGMEAGLYNRWLNYNDMV